MRVRYRLIQTHTSGSRVTMSASVSLSGCRVVPVTAAVTANSVHVWPANSLIELSYKQDKTLPFIRVLALFIRLDNYRSLSLTV